MKNITTIIIAAILMLTTSDCFAQNNRNNDSEIPLSEIREQVNDLILHSGESNSEGNEEIDFTTTYKIKDFYVTSKQMLETRTDSTDHLCSIVNIFPQFMHLNTTQKSFLILKVINCDTDDVICNDLLKKLKAMSVKKDVGYVTYGTADISFDDNEGFSAPFHYIYKIEDGLIKQYIYIHISNAFNSTNVEEINNGTWDNWTKLRYLNSCLDKKDIFFIHLTSDYDEYLGYIDFREPTAELIHKILYHLGSNLGTHRFYKFD